MDRKMMSELKSKYKKPIPVVQFVFQKCIRYDRETDTAYFLNFAVLYDGSLQKCISAHRPIGYTASGYPALVFEPMDTWEEASWYELLPYPRALLKAIVLKARCWRKKE